MRDNLKVLIAPQRDWAFAVFVDNKRIIEVVKRVEHENGDREKANNKKDSKPSGFVLRPKKHVRFDRTPRVEVSVGPPVFQPCRDCGRQHLGKCWRRLGACLK